MRLKSLQILRERLTARHDTGGIHCQVERHGPRVLAAAQSHFIDLCRLLGEQPATDADPKGEWYAFERARRAVEEQILERLFQLN
jgi:hypothetical protein